MQCNIELSPELTDIISRAPEVRIPVSKEELYSWVFGGENSDYFETVFEVGGKMITEAIVVRGKNGAVVNFPDDYMRRRDPDCMRIADDLPTDKPRFKDIYGYPFSELEDATYDWLASQRLIVMPFKAGGLKYGYDALLVCPVAAAFFAFSVAQLQAFVSINDVADFKPRTVLYVAPPFRHTHFGGKQVVVHNRLPGRHELFAYNLYPGPSAKKGIYSVLLDIGEDEGWVTAHASAARVITPYENEMVIMHEGASGGGKSELLQDVQREHDGRVLFSENIETGEKRYISMSDTCTIEPVTDDMAICLPSFRNGSKKLGLFDGEDGWFVRTDGITEYSSDPMYERITIHTKEPLVFYNLFGAPHATCLLWEHSLNSDGSTCPNPRVIIPRHMIDHIVNEPVEVDVRSFGVRMPPTSLDRPGFGIMGMLQIIPPALAWLWRLVSPRGYNNPSISATAGGGLQSEGVGSYWPFATGKRTRQANLLLRQILECENTRYVLIPNQFIGINKIGFSAEWISREYLARRGGINMKMDRLTPARCPLMGFSLKEMKVDGQLISSKFLHPEKQTTLGDAGYDAGAELLYNFFEEQLSQYTLEELDPIGQQIIEVFRNRGSIEDYCAITPLGLR
ncbi:MAG: DUF4914 family protein [Oscillospiraceae bacterium]|jgi:hypothetical protein|nr:DUF4914 family protein [Oscillospiraceae bacterium]